MFNLDNSHSLRLECLLQLLGVKKQQKQDERIISKINFNNISFKIFGQLEIIFFRCKLEKNKMKEKLDKMNNDDNASSKKLGPFRVFANGPGDLVLIPGRIIPKIQKMMPFCLTLSIIRYGLGLIGAIL